MSRKSNRRNPENDKSAAKTKLMLVDIEHHPTHDHRFYDHLRHDRMHELHDSIDTHEDFELAA